MKNNVYKLLSKIEPLIFYLILIISLIPIVSPFIFHTLDGAAHLHNAKLIIELLKGNDFIEQFYQINHLIVPNLTGHFFLAILLVFFPAHIALKAFLILYYSLFCLSFRKMVKSLKSQIALSYFIFPIGFSSFLILGFFNFMIGFIFIFFGISLLFKENQMLKKASFWIELFIWTTIIWFSHPILFLFWLIILAIFLFQNLFLEDRKSHTAKKTFQLLLYLFLITLPAIFLTINYLYNYNVRNVNIYTSLNEKLVYLYYFRTLLLNNFLIEKAWTIPICLSLFFLLITSYMKLFSNNKSIEKKLKIDATLWGNSRSDYLAFIFYLA